MISEPSIRKAVEDGLSGVALSPGQKAAILARCRPEPLQVHRRSAARRLLSVAAVFAAALVLSAGVLAIGGVSFGAFALGGLAAGAAALGGLALGYLALGGLAVGGYAIGGLACGLHVLGGGAFAAGFAAGDMAKGTIALGEDAAGQFAMRAGQGADAEALRALVLEKYPRIWRWFLELQLYLAR